MMTERVLSTCVVCVKSDTHPKHHPEAKPHHLDCGRQNGCETCDSMLRASGEKHGEELTRFMESRIEVSSGV